MQSYITVIIGMYRSTALPLMGSLLQNLTSIFIPSSVIFAAIASADFYYLVYYQDIELVLKGGKALEIVQVHYIIDCEKMACNSHSNR